MIAYQMFFVLKAGIILLIIFLSFNMCVFCGNNSDDHGAFSWLPFLLVLLITVISSKASSLKTKKLLK